MKHDILYLLALALIPLSCMIEEVPTDLPSVECVRFTAYTEGQDSTKTTLGEETDGFRKVLWEAEDKIGVGVNASYVEPFANIAGDSPTGIFEGNISSSDEYFAIYPYLQNTAISSTSEVEIPSVQVYRPNTYAANSFPMVAKAKSNKPFHFQNLCGALDIKLKGNANVTSITFRGFGEDSAELPVSGTGTFKWSYVDYPVLTMKSDARTKVTLDCGAGVALDPETATSFLIVLPPATYNGFEVMIRTADGQYMSKSTDKPLEINRSIITHASAFLFEGQAIDYIDLSENGNANTYIVSKAGDYCFDATVAGNGEFGIIDGMPMFADSPYINPVSAELVWEDHAGLVSGISYRDGRIVFTTEEIEGNALIAAKDTDGKILWSWHIWCTDKPAEHLYKNDYGEFTMMDRNLGATRADHGTGDEWHESCGLSYQWGRKDPFAGGLFTSSSESTDIAFSVENPAINMSNWDSGCWSPASKSIYDPCPAGYMVCSMDAWSGLSLEQVSGSFENGWNFIYDGVNSAWYPCQGYVSESGTVYRGDSNMWSSSVSNNLFYFSSTYIRRYSTSSGLNLVRCMKQGSFNQVLLSIAPVSSITSSSADLSCEIAVNGNVPATETGFVYGTSPSPEIDSATKVECSINDHKINTTLSGLSAYTKYYVRAYAIYQGETYYSEERSFYTPNESGIVDLSLGGTSNSYIVPPTSCTYSIPLVKGKSNETVGAAASAELLWETLNTSDAVTAGVLIESVEIKDGKLMFKVSDDKVPGNALIAVMNSSDEILWSWHIWVVDFEPLSSAQLYKSGALMMDRNLGALNTSRNDSRAFGLMYQWGRKDPFVGSGKYNSSTFAATSPENAISSVSSTGVSNSINYATEYPNVFIKSSSWNDDNSLWSDVKTIYDPCPSGWRVPDSEVWNGFSSGVSDNNGILYSDSSPVAFYPKTGYIYSYSYSFNELGYEALIWTNSLYAYFTSKGASIGSIASSQGFTVRCMKDAEFTVSMDTDATKVGATTAVFKGEVSVLDGTQMDASGFILSHSSGSPSIYNEDAQVFDAQNKSGIIEVKATGLLPSTTYYVRAYAKGGHNVRYSTGQTIKTNVAGSIIDIGIEDVEL